MQMETEQGTGAPRRQAAQMEGVREGSLEEVTLRQNDPPYAAGSGVR